jgi:hypothetical protein
MLNTDIIDRIVSEPTRELLREVENTLTVHASLRERVLDLRLLVDRGIEELRREGSNY